MSATLLTLSEVLAELQVGRSTFNRWMQLGDAPTSIRLPGGQLRFRRKDVERWLEARSTAGEVAA
ncbi:helix-turn-helix transcriptional regulator [Actinoalloteichus sp. GBA129-24]|uniref:helix-turn-helix transcriptional regulator n=1 Tax=Actinoalloteichus sp. GBA129-24 TaxID=1612551 RepID=UPI00095142B7|nr:helix-turn-helix domain-containing protein [Actinoalloteichus sp. GBA129-24]